jgi:hypothetical protein
MTSKYRRSIWHQHQPYTTDLPADLRSTESPRTLRGLFAATAGVVALMLFIFASLLAGAAIDERAQREHEQLLTKAERTSQALPTKLAEAYERGLADAMESINGTPQGVALAQACLASGMGGRP